MRDGTIRSYPGLVDLQVNGYAGHDVNAEDLSPADVVALTRALWSQGVTTFLPTIITATEERIEGALRAIVTARDSDPQVAHSIVGVHVEGPALNPEDGPRGAHDPALMRDPDLGELDRWQAASGGLVRIVTLAPERPGSLEYIAGAVARGIRVALGHCAATPPQIHAAIDAGATLSTHLGNGTHRRLLRHPNHIWSQLAADALTAMFIADGHHVPGDALTAMIRAKSPTRCVLTSDAAALAGSPPGTYRTPVGGSVTVTREGSLMLTGTGLLAGSGASLLGCVDWALANLPFDEATIVSMATTTPARILGLDERVASAGDEVVIERTAGVSRVVSTSVGGTEVYRAG
ncbi:N-acetylglucosamine-6-phosphate deacetylase [Nitriliruptor alkaliphilus]|uniref:N-acetylglucosamine-6-phosphate deacetylase n=1 Tax=Nitriliruptor alkaliphilus TaxID=427918 RepID=UPI0006964EBD|nr:amidohydrolase family protein [Nitriliruptor alkaliphilus]